MKVLIILLLLVCLPAIAVGTDEGNLRGAWLRDGVKWTKAPSKIRRNLTLGQAEILYFGEQQVFAIIDCTVNRVPKEYETISQGDAQGLYKGKWEAKGDDIVIEYVLVSRTVQLKGEVLPGPIQHARIKASDKVLHLNGKTFRRATALDKSAAEMVAGLTSTQ